MRKFKPLLSILLILIMITGLIPLELLHERAFAEPNGPHGDNLTNSSTVVDLEALKAIIDDDTDSNDDGLPDQLKRMLGLDPELEDTIGDGLSDKFKLENSLDPLKYDTNGIGISDFYALTKGNEDINITADMLDEDMDGDGIPDIQDEDIDGDRVPNAVDLSPFSHLEPAESQQINLTTSGKAADLRLQVQPADMESLLRNSRVMTWPVDTRGQMTNFDATEDNVHIVPMLEVDMEEYPDEEVLEEWGYLLFQDQLYIPLQYVEHDYQPVALEGNIHFPAEHGTPQGEKYEIELEVRLSWLMVGQTHTVTSRWEPFARVQSLQQFQVPVFDFSQGFFGRVIEWEDREEWRDIVLEDFDARNNREYLGSDIASYSESGKPDLFVYWVENNKVYEKVYYNLEFDEDLYVYRAGDVGTPSFVHEFEWIDQKKRIEPDPHSDLTRVHNAKFIVNRDRGVRNTAYYTVNDADNSVEVTANHFSPGPRKEFNIENHGFFAEERNSRFGDSFWWHWPQPRKYSYIRDAAFKYIPDRSYTAYGTVFYLYEMYNQDTGKNEIALMLDHSEQGGSGGIVGHNIKQTEVLIDDLPADTTDQSQRSWFRNLEKGLSVDIHDINKDGNDDLMFTDRSGRMFVVLDVYGGEGWQDRIYQIPDNREIDGVHGQHTSFYDFTGDGHKDMVGIQAVRTRQTAGTGYARTDLNFRISTKKDIDRSTEILMKDSEAFAITGMQVQEHQGVETHLITGEDTEELLYMAAMFYQWYLQSDYSMADVVNEYVEKVMDGDRENIDEITGSYDHLFAALLDVGKEIHENEDWKEFDGPKPLLVLTWEEDRYLNLDDLEEGDFLGRQVTLDISGTEVVTSKQLILKWIEDGAALSPREINEMVEANAEDLFEFREDPEGNKEVLAKLNLGVGEIIGIGDGTIQVKPFLAYSEALDDFKALVITGDVLGGIPMMARIAGTKILPALYGTTTFLPPPGSPILQANDPIYKAKLAKYRAMTGKLQLAGKILKGAGLLIDVGLGVYSGYLYGQAMAGAGGTAFGVVTGLTYGVLTLTYVGTLFLLSIGPGSWVVMGLLMADALIAYFVQDYDGFSAIFDAGVSVLMSLLFDARVYPGTVIRKVEQTDDEDKNRQIYTNSEYGYVLGSQLEDLSQYRILIRAATKNTPANNHTGLSDSRAWIDIRNRSNSVTTENNRYKSKDHISKVNGYWQRDYLWDFHNILTFEKPGLALAVDEHTSFWYRLIGSVTETRTLWWTNTEYEYVSDSISSKSAIYYDVMPDSLEMFWEFFDFIDWDENSEHPFPRVKHNEIAYRSPYYDYNGDGVPDRIKKEYDLNPELADTNGDGLTDFEKLKLGLEPLSDDTDGDGVSDYTEVNVPVELEITTSEGSVTAWAYSDPLLYDTSGDGYNDAQKRGDGLNPATRHTHGHVLFDYNEYAPELIQEFEDMEVVDLDWLEFNLAEYITDQDGDDLMFTVSHGEVEENENGDYIWTYQFNMAENGRYVELTIEANDLRGGILKTSFLVFDESGPAIVQIRADYDDAPSIDPVNLEHFLQPLPSNPGFYTRFNKPIDFDEIDGESIFIGPLGDRAHLDADSNFDPLSTAVDISLLDEETFYEISITRSEAIVEDGIEYQLFIPGDAVQDRDPEDPYSMDKDYEIRFFTEDNEQPKIVEVRYGLDGTGSAWDLNNPLVIEFNEDIILADTRYPAFAAASDPYRRKFPIRKHDGTYIGEGEGHLLMNMIDSKTIQVEIEPNYLENNTTYRLQKTPEGSRYDIRDLAGNIFETFYLGENIPTFDTGDVRGPAINEDRNNSIRADEQNLADGKSYDNYEVDIRENGEIHINFDQPIYPGSLYDNIVLAYGGSIHLWMYDVMRDEVKGTNLPHEIRIEDEKLIITPEVPFAADNEYIAYTVYIPSKALVDSTGNTIFEQKRYDHSNTRWSADYNDFTQVVRARREDNADAIGIFPVVIDHVAVPREWGHRSILEAMINYPEGDKNIVIPGKTLMAVLSDRVNSLNVEDISLWKLDDEGSEMETIAHSAHFTPGSNVVLITPHTELDSDAEYKIKFAESEIEIVIEGPEGGIMLENPPVFIPEGELFNYTFANPASESVFTISNEAAEQGFSGGNDMSPDSFVGMNRVGEVLGISGGIGRYYDMFNDRFERKEDLLTYQWYRGDTADPAGAEPIAGADKILYIPRAEDEGKYLFLKLQVDFEGLDDYIPEELRYGFTEYEIMSPALGPVMPAFHAGTELQDISVLAEGEEGAELLANFNNEVTAYEISVPPGTTMVRVIPEFDEALNSFVRINGLPAEYWKDVEEDGEPLPDGLEIALEMGENTIYVTSTAENYLAQKVFVININRDAETEGDIGDVPPEARFVKIQNDKEYFTGKTLTGTYKFFDELSREEEGTTYQWYRHPENNAASREPISGATGLTYTVIEDDVDHYLSFEVTPKARDSVAGEPELSWWIGPVGLVNDKETGIVDIEVLYSGDNILGDYEPGKKIYPTFFASEEGDSTITIQVTGGDNVSINGTPGDTATFDFYEDRLIEVVADSVNLGEPTSYFIILSDEPIPAAIFIEGEEEIELGEDDETVRWHARVYDQYGNEMEEDVDWNTAEIPGEYDYIIWGTHSDRLTIDIPADSASYTINVEAWVKNAGDVSEEKPLEVMGKPPAQLSALTENLAADFEPPFDGGTYEYYLAAGKEEMEVSLTATLEDATISYSYEDRTEGWVENKEVPSGTAETINLNVGENSIIIEVTKEGHLTSIYTVIINREPPEISGVVSITGEARYGEELTADLSGIIYTPETTADEPTFKWYRDGTEIAGATGATYILTEADIGSVVTVTVTADGINATGSVTSEATATVTKAAGPEAPGAPEMAGRTTTSITLHEIAGAEYNIDGGPWQDSPEFSDLEPGTAYEFRARIKETATHFASAESIPAAIATEEEEEIRYGYVLDGETITVADAIVVLRHIVGISYLEKDALQRAKVSEGDGPVSVQDAILILRYIVELIDKFPIEH